MNKEDFKELLKESLVEMIQDEELLLVPKYNRQTGEMVDVTILIDGCKIDSKW